MDPQTIQTIIAVAGVAIAIPSFYIGYRDIIERPRKARQEILDRLNYYKSGLKQPASDQEEYQNLTESAYELAQLESMTSMPIGVFYKALIKLYTEGKVDACVVNVIVENSHPSIPPGSKVKIPFFVKGLLPPHLRSPKEEVLEILQFRKQSAS